jgi:expansin (peptidoglycan-binding protein)
MLRRMRALLAVLAAPVLVLSACSSGGPPSGADGGTITLPDGAVVPVADGGPIPSGDGGPQGPLVLYGQKYEGGEYHLGPVDYAETAWHNACAPPTKYAPAVQQAQGNLLAGLWNGIPNTADYCDACIWVTTAKGKSAMLRVVTYGDTTMNSIDVSPEAYALLDSGEYPRKMSWQFAKCPDTGKVLYEFQTMASEWWTSLWVRNARVPIKKVEVKSANHADFVALQRGTDGTLTDHAGFGKGPFTIQLTGIDGSVYTDTFQWPAQGIGGQTLTGQGNFP